MRRPFSATAFTDRDICSIDVAFCSTAVFRLSVIAPTSSIEAAISLIADEVSSADTARSLALSATAEIERDISSIAAAVSVTELAKSSVSRLMVLEAAAICVIDVATWCADAAMLSVVARTA